MTPLRAFLFSFTAGLSLLFSGQALFNVVFPEPPLHAPAPVA